MKKEEYVEYVKKNTPKHSLWKNCLGAFLIGGTICLIGEFIGSFFKKYGLDEKMVGTLTSIVLIFLGSSLTAIGVYDKIAKVGGGGTLIPITGFANAIVSPAMEYKNEGHIMGIGAKMFTIAGPAIVFGVISSVVAGLIVYFMNFL